MSNSINNHLGDLNINHLDHSHRELASLPGERSDLGYQHIELKKGMKLESLSIIELRSQLDEIELLIRSLDIHVLTLNETRLDPKYPNELQSTPVTVTPLRVILRILSQFCRLPNLTLVKPI